MKKECVFLSILVIGVLLGVFSVSAVDETTIADGWYPAKDSFDKNGCHYNIRGAELADTSDDGKGYKDGKVLIKRTCDNLTTSEVLQYDECETTSSYEWCFSNASYDDDNIMIDETGQLQPGIRLDMTAFAHTSDLDVSRSFSSTDLNLKENVNVTITLENSGDIPISTLDIVEPIPKGFELVSTDSFFHHVVSEDILKSSFKLYPDVQRNRSYTLKAVEYGSASTRTNITYQPENEDEQETHFSSTTLKVPSPYSLSFTSFDSSFDKGDSTTLKFGIKNKENEELTMERLVVTTPLNVKVTPPSSFSETESRTFEYTGTIPASSKKVFPFELNLPFVGEYEFSYSTSFSVKGREYEESGSSKLTVGVEQPSCHYNFSSQNMEAGAVHEYSAYLEHTGEETFYDINCTYSDPYRQNGSFYEVTIHPDEKVAMYENVINLPVVGSEVSRSFNLTCRYRTDNNQYFTCADAATIDIQPVPQRLNLSTTITPSNVTAGEDVSVDVRATNLLSEPITDTVMISEEGISGGDIQGVIETTLDGLAVNASEDVYSYNLTVPKDRSDNISLSHEISFDSSEYTDSFTDTITVTSAVDSSSNLSENISGLPDSEASSSKGESGDSSDESSGEESEDKGFVDKILSVIRSIFG